MELRSGDDAPFQSIHQVDSKQKLAHKFWSPWEIDPERLTVGRRVAVGGFAEVFVGKYEVGSHSFDLLLIDINRNQQGSIIIHSVLLLLLVYSCVESF